jgi:3',5'-cyclic AMP phosphodiesterase CpdA
MKRLLGLAILGPLLFLISGDLTLPVKNKSVRFAVIGDSGTGEKAQYEVGAQMEKYRASFPFEFTLMLGDNLYGKEHETDFLRKFEQPYKGLLDDGVKFYASLGNHDNPNERFYKPFNMGGQRYYTFKNGDVQFFALDSNYMDPEQLKWLTKQLSESHATWKVCFFHHPLYSDGRFHGPDVDLRARLEPIFEANGVNAVFSGHEHVYERIKPQHGIYYFVLGNAGELRLHGLKPSPDMVKGFDTDQAFMMVEIAEDTLYFQAVSRTGQTIDSGSLSKQETPALAGHGTEAAPAAR